MTLKIVTVIGARPQIIKAAALSRAIQTKFFDKINEVIVHTGQHYDQNMSQVFFEELGIPQPDYNLNVGSGSHGKQTALMIEKLEEVLFTEKPNAIVLYGDTNSTLAGAIAASKILIPVIHIEAGLRSFNKSMPEEINRIMCDHVSTLLFSPSKTGYNNLVKEGFKENTNPPYTSDNPKIYHCGDIMYDNSLYFSTVSDKKSTILQKYQINKNDFILITIHRNNNTDDPSRLDALFRAIHSIAEKSGNTMLIPLHPRTSKLLEKQMDAELYKKIISNSKIKIIEPVSFFDMIQLEKSCKLVMTDSGGVQKEAFFFEKPCIILRPETEWVELVECGMAKVVDADEKNIINAFDHYTNIKTTLFFPPLYGNGKAAEFICEEMVKHL